MSNRIFGQEPSRRRDRWTQGTWITLADGHQWCFPPAATVPGHAEFAVDLSRVFVDNMMPLTNVQAIVRQTVAARHGDVDGLMKSYASMFNLYRVVYLAGRFLLAWNYDLDDAEVDALVPINFCLEDADAARARLDAFGPATAVLANSIAAVSGIDIGSVFDRMGMSN